MKIIAHRGLLNGPDKSVENSPKQIQKALDLGFDCEIDVWYIDHCWLLGHDIPTYITTLEFLSNPNLWIHTKNEAALSSLLRFDVNVFWHDTDCYTLTSKGYIWAYPGKPLTSNSINVLPEWNDPSLDNINTSCAGVCTDYPILLRDKLLVNIASCHTTFQNQSI